MWVEGLNGSGGGAGGSQGVGAFNTINITNSTTNTTSNTIYSKGKYWAFCFLWKFNNDSPVVEPIFTTTATILKSGVYSLPGSNTHACYVWCLDCDAGDTISMARNNASNMSTCILFVGESEYDIDYGMIDREGSFSYTTTSDSYAHIAFTAAISGVGNQSTSISFPSNKIYRLETNSHTKIGIVYDGQVTASWSASNWGMGTIVALKSVD